MLDICFQHWVIFRCLFSFRFIFGSLLTNHMDCTYPFFVGIPNFYRNLAFSFLEPLPFPELQVMNYVTRFPILFIIISSCYPYKFPMSLLTCIVKRKVVAFWKRAAAVQCILYSYIPPKGDRSNARLKAHQGDRYHLAPRLCCVAVSRCSC